MKRILFLMADTGGGHRSSAEAIAAALQAYPEYQAQVVDVFRCAPFPLNQIPKTYRPIVNYFGLPYRWVFQASNHLWATRAFTAILTPSLRPGLQRLFAATRPDLVVACHPLYNHIPVRVLRQTEARVPFVTVVTDLASGHRLWFCRDVDLCIVPLDELKILAESVGLAPGKVRVAGVPVHSRFTEAMPDRATLRRELGLDPCRPTFLLVSGGEGMGKLFEFADVLARAGLEVQLIVIAGRNRRLQERLSRQLWPVPVKVFGFVQNMHQLMRASDVIVTKAGPSTICEALVCGLPILLSGFVPGQEEGNVRHLLDHGAGRLLRSPRELAETARELLRPDNPALTELAERAGALARPDAAQQIAALLVELVRS